MARRKSYKEIGSQFRRIWHTAVESSDAYKSIKSRYPNMENWELFQRADLALRGEGARGLNTPLTDRDRQLNARINAADRTSQRYQRNIARKAGISDTVHYYGTTEQRAANDVKENRKYSRNTYMGLANG